MTIDSRQARELAMAIKEEIHDYVKTHEKEYAQFLLKSNIADKSEAGEGCIIETIPKEFDSTLE